MKPSHLFPEYGISVDIESARVARNQIGRDEVIIQELDGSITKGTSLLNQGKGTKYDDKKPMLALIPPKALFEIGKAFTAGKDKYGQWNWANGIAVVRLVSGALRHIFQFLMGENIDKETGVHHLGCACANLMMAHDTIVDKPEFDDRFKSGGSK